MMQRCSDLKSARSVLRPSTLMGAAVLASVLAAGCASQSGPGAGSKSSAASRPASVQSAAAQAPGQPAAATPALEGLHEAFELWDRTGKGMLSADDIRVAGEQGFRTLDRNADGHITATEMLATRIDPAVFNGANEDSDNTIDPAEYQALLTKLARQAGGGDGSGVTQAQLSGSAQGRALAHLMAGR